MSRTIYLEDSKPDDIKAKLDKGVLQITVPKEEKAIEISYNRCWLNKIKGASAGHAEAPFIILLTGINPFP